MEIPKIVGRVSQMCTIDTASFLQCVASGKPKWFYAFYCLPLDSKAMRPVFSYCLKLKNFEVNKNLSKMACGRGPMVLVFVFVFFGWGGAR